MTNPATSSHTRAAGRVLMVSLPGPDLDRCSAERLRALGAGGVILFARNLDSAEAAARLVAELRAVLPAPALVALDQEGGRVSRLEPFVGPTPPAARLVRKGVRSVRRFAAATADALSSLGFNLDFAPVVDLCVPEATNGIGDRAFGTDPDAVTELAGAFLDGLQRRGVAGCLKHFPGLGATVVDSHEQLPTADRSGAELEREELRPYRALAALAASVMVGHGHYPALDPEPGRPASLSRAIVDGLLRRRIGFEGLVVSDDLEMGAVASLDVEGAAAVAAVEAGCDLVLYCSDLDRAERAKAALISRSSDDAVFARRLAGAARSVERTARRWPLPPPATDAWARARSELVAASAEV